MDMMVFKQVEADPKKGGSISYVISSHTLAGLHSITSQKTAVFTMKSPLSISLQVNGNEQY
jgi:hypothetical protein